MQFQDYYKTLEVPRTATAAEIKKSYRRLSKQYHPDVNVGSTTAEDKFKQLGEAYEVLKDPEKRKKYDQLGQQWNQPGAGMGGGGAGGSPFGAGWQNVDWNVGGAGGGRGTPSGFSDFFDTFFAQQGMGGQPRRGGGGRRPRDPFEGGFEQAQHGEAKEAQLTIPLEDVVMGVTKTITLQQPMVGPDGGRRVDEKTYTVKIPAGSVAGTKIRLKGEGGKGRAGGVAGDLYLTIDVAPHPRFVVDGFDLTARLFVAPWEAAFGAKVPFLTLEGEVKLTVPKASTSGAKLRLKAKGLPKKDGERGNLTVEIVVVTPTDLTADEEALLTQWQGLRASWDPRAGR
ncbi:MAG: J domain-containing protein [Deltaproteobacteria bacterium]|nr:J domain-containing protein [Deltaproteobacteria bacterium]